MHDSTGLPACFSGKRHRTDPASATSNSSYVYRTEISGQPHLITITWYKDLLLHGLSVAFQGPGNSNELNASKLELKPWHFWRKQGSKNLIVEGTEVGVAWDLRVAVFEGETTPSSDYHVAVVCEDEVILLVGDMKKEAYMRTGCRPALIDPVLVSRTEHLFGKKKFFTMIKFHEKGKLHRVSVMDGKNVGSLGNGDLEMEIAIDSEKVAHVKHLQWKFRVNEDIKGGGRSLEVYWDVHDWLFGSGPRHGLFIFRPAMAPKKLLPSIMEELQYPPPASPLPVLVPSEEQNNFWDQDNWESGNSLPGFSFFMYAWKTD